MHTAIRSPCANGSDDARRGDASVGLAWSRQVMHNSFSVLSVGTEVRVWLRQSGRCAGRRAEDGQGAVEARSQMTNRTYTATV